MTSPIRLLESRLSEINEVEELCLNSGNLNDLMKVREEKEKYICCIGILKQYFETYKINRGTEFILNEYDVNYITKTVKLDVKKNYRNSVDSFAKRYKVSPYFIKTIVKKNQLLK
jgi:hypothetical protein